MMGDMGQQHSTAHPTNTRASDTRATDLTPDLCAPGDDNSWQQPPLLLTTEQPPLVTAEQPRPQPHSRAAAATKPAERLRQAGLVGIARARTALAEATRRADEARAAQRETKAA